ncbi:hypothetical protein RMR16_008090 [Agrobacterium sp. rho-13.3]|uniref:hypothetical protein n=1 Tax=Agrobacterium sp. rho-13.3 TaxID=3072980 RepID=UPI003D7B7324
MALRSWEIGQAGKVVCVLCTAKAATVAATWTEAAGALWNAKDLHCPACHHHVFIIHNIVPCDLSELRRSRGRFCPWLDFLSVSTALFSHRIIRKPLHTFRSDALGHGMSDGALQAAS